MEDIAKKYKSKIYTKDGEINLRTIKSIAKEAGLDNINVWRNEYGTFINFEVIDPSGYGEEAEVISIYRFCEWLISRDKKLSREKKLKELLG